MRYLTLPTRLGSVTLSASSVASIESTGESTCKIHMKKPQVSDPSADKFTHEGYGASEHHNVFEVKMAVEELRTAIGELKDGEHYDPLGLETLSNEIELLDPLIGIIGSELLGDFGNG